jgi:lipoprotein-anchoring transpeptidase ErfK/SrfK
LRRRKKYQLPGARTAGYFLWLVVLLLAAVAFWIYWEYRHPEPTAERPSTEPARTPTLRMTKPGGGTGNLGLNVDSQKVVTKRPTIVARGTAETDKLVQPSNTQKQVSNEPVQETVSTNGYPRPVQNVFEAQVALARRHFSAGSIDGIIGSQTRQAIRAWQQSVGLEATGELTAVTREKLMLETSPWTTNTVDAADLGRLQPLSASWAGKAQQTALDYETVLEMLAERSQSSPKLLKQANPGIDWDSVKPGTSICVPDVTEAVPAEKAEFVTIRLQEKTLQVFGAQTNLVAHFPCSIAQRVDKRPVGELKIAVVAPDPDYTFDPAVFPESPEARQLGTKLLLPPGPNNPVGAAWIGLDKPGYGIHGTPNPEAVGRTESHGCFRLSNWNAQCLLKLVRIGTPVYVVD